MIIGDWEVDPKSNEITSPARSIRLSPLGMDILLHLASQAGKVVDTNELIERNWPANKGSDNTLYKVISELRRALDDKDRSARKIESVAKRGYRLTLTVKRDLAESSVGHTSNHQQLLKESLEQGKGRLATRNYTLAARHFNVALDLCLREKDVDKNLLAELYLLIGDCVLQEQGKDSAESYFIQARDIALEVENHTDYARALLGLSGNLQPIITGAAKSLANQLQLAYLAIPKTEKSLALRLRARMISFSNPIGAKTLEEAEQVVTEARRSAEPDLLIYALLALHESLRSLGEVTRQTSLSEEIFSLARQSVDRDLVIVGYLRRISDFLVLGQRSEAEQLRQEMESLKPRILFQDELNRIDASFAIMDGDFEEAEQYAMAISFRESGYLLMQFLQLITVARFRGEAEQMLPLIESVSADYTDLPAVKVYLALLYADVGQFSASEEELGKLKPDLSGLNQDISWHAMLVALTEVAVLTKNLDLAQTLLERLLPFSGTQLVFTTICVFGSADLYIGLLKNLLGHADAVKCFYLALEQNQKVGHLPMVARSKLLVSEITTG